MLVQTCVLAGLRAVNGNRMDDHKAECQRCRGREHGDCDPACRHWRWTATQAEWNAAGRRGDDYRPRTQIAWRGPRFSEEDGVDGEAQ